MVDAYHDDLAAWVVDASDTGYIGEESDPSPSPSRDV